MREKKPGIVLNIYFKAGLAFCPGGNKSGDY